LLQRAAGDGGSLRFGHELHLVETGGQVAGAQIRLGCGFAGIADAVEHHGPPRKDAVKYHASVGLGPCLHLGQKAGDDVDEGHLLVQDLPALMHEAGAQDALERPHEAPFGALEQGLIGGFANQHPARVVVEEEGRRYGGLAGRELR
jgi:hypothetical protein